MQMSMARIRLCFAFLLTAMVALLQACAGGYQAGKRPLNAELVLLSYGSVNGELAPCG